jgi:hypothetical protein
LGIPTPEKGRGKRKQNKQMEKFKELSIAEMQGIDGGGFILWSPSISLTEFAAGVIETFSDSFERYRQEIKYQPKS